MLAVEQILADSIGTDATWGRKFPSPLIQRGLTGSGASIHVPATGGKNASALCWSLTLSQLRERIADLLPEKLAAVDKTLQLLTDPTFFDFTFATAIAWGRRPMSSE